ncbi:MAG: hypothetical protein IPG91_05565 [Ideonella sp.]|nr:hypothetical protein [Ideonella sp.]
MKTTRKVLLYVLVAIGAGQAAAQGAATIVESDERSLDQGGQVEFQRGVFRVNPDGSQVTLLCIQVGPKWQYVGSQRDCGDTPPKELRREIERFPDDKTHLGILNLGIDNGQWQELRRGKGSSGSVLAAIGDAFSYQIGTNDVRWHLDSAKLPRELRTPIPGAAISVHFGKNFSDAQRPQLFTAGTTLLVESMFALPKAATNGHAHTGLTIAVDMEVPTVGGRNRILTMIVNVFHPDPRGKEAVRSDGRVNFGSSYLGPGTKYVVAVANRQKTAPWQRPERFAFRLTRENVKNLIEEANKHANPSGKAREPFDVSRLNDVRLSSVTLRNENRFLDRGTVDVDVVVDYLRAVREPAR